MKNFPELISFNRLKQECTDVKTSDSLSLHICSQCNGYQVRFPDSRETVKDIGSPGAAQLYLSRSFAPNFYSDSLCRKPNTSHDRKKKGGRRKSKIRSTELIDPCDSEIYNHSNVSAPGTNNNWQVDTKSQQLPRSSVSSVSSFNTNISPNHSNQVGNHFLPQNNQSYRYSIPTSPPSIVMNNSSPSINTRFPISPSLDLLYNAAEFISPLNAPSYFNNPTSYSAESRLNSIVKRRDSMLLSLSSAFEAVKNPNATSIIF